MIKKIKSQIIAGFRNKKINVFFLFLLMAVIILIFLKLSRVYTNTIVFTINKVNVPQEYVILKDTNNTLDITLKAYGFNWLKYYFSKPKITIDFKKDVEKKDTYFVWNNSKTFFNSEAEFGSQVTLLNISPDKLYFKYDVNLVKKVPVILNADISFKPGYDMFNPYALVPDSINVIGPHVLVSKIERVVTEKVKMDNVNSDILNVVTLKLPKDNKDLIFSNDRIELKATVERFTEGTLKVPVSVINVPEGTSIKYFPKIINVIYYTSLKNYNDVTAKDFKVVCDYNKITNSQSFLLPELIKVTDKVKTAKINQQHIEFIIEE
tara:strand:- start:17690 stop:18655 length:966 start_codon:yes stop_codon:yes gene_type:complete